MRGLCNGWAVLTSSFLLSKTASCLSVAQFGWVLSQCRGGPKERDLRGRAAVLPGAGQWFPLAAGARGRGRARGAPCPRGNAGRREKASAYFRRGWRSPVPGEAVPGCHFEVRCVRARRCGRRGGAGRVTGSAFQRRRRARAGRGSPGGRAGPAPAAPHRRAGSARPGGSLRQLFGALPWLRASVRTY